MIGENNFIQKNTSEKREDTVQTIEVIHEFSEEVLEKILELRKESLPESWQFEDVKEYYEEAIRNEKNIPILLRENDRAVGYLLAIPHEDAYEELSEVDSEFKHDDNRYYVEVIHMLPEFRKGRGFLKLILKMIEESENRGCTKFSMHARVNNGLSNVIQRVFADIITGVRRVENWKFYGGEEPADYIETDSSFKKNETE